MNSKCQHVFLPNNSNTALRTSDHTWKEHKDDPHASGNKNNERKIAVCFLDAPEEDRDEEFKRRKNDKRQSPKLMGTANE